MELPEQWVLLQDLSEHEAKDFTQTLNPSTCKGSGRGNSRMVWVTVDGGGWRDDNTKGLPRRMTMFKVSGSSTRAAFPDRVGNLKPIHHLNHTVHALVPAIRCKVTSISAKCL